MWRCPAISERSIPKSCRRSPFVRRLASAHRGTSASLLWPVGVRRAPPAGAAGSDPAVSGHLFPWHTHLMPASCNFTAQDLEDTRFKTCASAPLQRLAACPRPKHEPAASPDTRVGTVCRRVIEDGHLQRAVVVLRRARGETFVDPRHRIVAGDDHRNEGQHHPQPEHSGRAAVFTYVF